MTIRFSREEMARFGSGSLVGKLTNMGIIQPCPITIEFEDSTLSWKRNNGPEMVSVPEFVFRMLCDDILVLTKMGYDITIGSWENNPPIEDGDERIKCLEQSVDRLKDEKISADNDFCDLLQALNRVTRGEY